MRRRLLLLIPAVVLGVAADDVRAAEAVCLSSSDVGDAVAGRKVIPPDQALGIARKAVPNGDVLRAALCREPGVLVYRITVLRRDGRLVRVTLDAPSGKVRTIR